MNFKKMSSKKQATFLKSLLKSEKETATGNIAVSAFKHYLITKQHGDSAVRPVLRWYLGQLAKEFIKKSFKEATATLENFAEIGLLEAKYEPGNLPKEYCLKDSLFPALKDALEKIFGKEYIDKIITGIKYYRPPGSRENKTQA